MRIIVGIGLWLVLSGFFYVGKPFQSADALAQIDAETTVWVGITHVVLGNDEAHNDIFWAQTDNVLEALTSMEGYLGHALRKKVFVDDAWTLTVWQSEAALNDFVGSTVHATAIGKGLIALKKGGFVRFSIPKSELPIDWEKAEMMMKTKGRKRY